MTWICASCHSGSLSCEDPDHCEAEKERQRAKDDFVWERLKEEGYAGDIY